MVSRTKVLILKYSPLARLFRLRYFSLNDLDKKLELYLDFDNGYFVELGANDGVNQSNTLYFERFRGWSGVLIEPHLSNFEALIKNRSANNYFKNSACVGPSYDGSTIELAYSNLMTSTLGIKSDVSNPIDHANDGAVYWGGTTYVFHAPASTLNSILIEAGAPDHMDLLSLDVEGVELEVLKGIDHSRFRFRSICVESRNFQELSEYLEEFDYCYITSLSSHDYLFQNVQVLK